MKTSVISLLLVVLAVSWAVAAPYPDPQPQAFDSEEWQDDLQDDDSQEDIYVRKKRQFHAGLGANRGPFGRDYNANVGYNHHFNKGRTSVGVNAYKNWGASGKSHGAGLTFTHRFGR